MRHTIERSGIHRGTTPGSLKRHQSFVEIISIVPPVKIGSSVLSSLVEKPCDASEILHDDDQTLIRVQTTSPYRESVIEQFDSFAEDLERLVNGQPKDVVRTIFPRYAPINVKE